MQPPDPICRWCGADEPPDGPTCPACGGVAVPTARIPRAEMQVVHVEAWSALEALVGPDGQAPFMYMCTLEGRGLRIHLYKHRDTRRYLNLGENGTAYRYVDDSYEEIDREAALLHALS